MKRILVTVLLVLLIDTAAWAFVCNRLEAGMRDAVLGAQEQGWLIGAAGQHWGGWPFAAEIDLAGVSAAGPVPAGLVWRAAHARIRLSLLHPTTLTIPVEGAQSVAAQGLAPIPVATASTVIAADLTGAAPVRARVRGLQAGTDAGALTIGGAELAFPPGGLEADLTRLVLPGIVPPADSLGLRMRIEPPFPVTTDPRDGALAWREAGGHVDIAAAALRWGALDATGHGKITLDAQLQPEASGTVQAGGLPALLDQLAKAGTLTPAQASAAKAVVGLIAAASSGNRVALPFSLEDGVLRIARFPLLRFAPLAWN